MCLANWNHGHKYIQDKLKTMITPVITVTSLQGQAKVQKDDSETVAKMDYE